MPVFQESTYDDRHLTRYLLGQLAEEDADRLDELAIVDDDMAWRVRTVENDLVDAFVRGVLDAKSRQQFESHYLASSKRRAKVRFAERFARAVDAFGSPTERPERRRGWRDGLVPRTEAKWGFTYAYAAAALLLVAAFGSLLLMRDARPERVMREADQARVQAEAPAPFSSPSTPPKSPSAAPPVSPPRSPSAPAVAVAVVLWPQTRGAGENASAEGTALPAVAVPDGVAHVMLELQLESPDFVRYSATLKESDTNRIVWHGDRLAAAVSGDAPMVPVAVPANLLKPRAYVLELTGSSAADGGDIIGSYAFQVTRR